MATPQDAQEVCQAIRGQIREAYGDAAADGVRILYGGSVKAANVAGIMAEADVDGCLVGGASLQADEFGGICRYYDMPITVTTPTGWSPEPDVGFPTVDLFFTIVLMISSALMILLVLLHKGRGGGLSDMFGGGVSSSLGGSSVAERNLDRLTVGIGVIWFACVIALGLLLAYQS